MGLVVLEAAEQAVLLVLLSLELQIQVVAAAQRARQADQVSSSSELDNKVRHE
jgi:hypothetical protein